MDYIQNNWFHVFKELLITPMYTHISTGTVFEKIELENGHKIGSVER